MPTRKKIEAVSQLKEFFEKAEGYIFVDYQGSTMSNLTELRNNLEKLEAVFIVAKNTLIEKAAQIKNEGPTAVLFALANPLNALKTLVNFSKINPAIKIKTGFIEGKNYGGNELVELSKLPTRETLIAKIAGLLKSPIARLSAGLSVNQRKLALVLNLVAKKKQM